jgi:hypothetical protein
VSSSCTSFDTIPLKISYNASCLYSSTIVPILPVSWSLCPSTVSVATLIWFCWFRSIARTKFGSIGARPTVNHISTRWNLRKGHRTLEPLPRLLLSRICWYIPSINDISMRAYRTMRAHKAAHILHNTQYRQTNFSTKVEFFTNVS